MIAVGGGRTKNQPAGLISILVIAQAAIVGGYER